MKLPFELDIPQFRRDTLGKAQEVLLREVRLKNGTFVDVLALINGDKIYIGTFKAN